MGIMSQYFMIISPVCRTPLINDHCQRKIQLTRFSEEFTSDDTTDTRGAL